MSYSVSGSGHNADLEQVKEAFAAFVSDLDDATAEGGTKFNGTISGSEDGVPFTLTAEDTRQHEDETTEAAPEAESK